MRNPDEITAERPTLLEIQTKSALNQDFCPDKIGQFWASQKRPLRELSGVFLLAESSSDKRDGWSRPIPLLSERLLPERNSQAIGAGTYG